MAGYLQQRAPHILSPGLHRSVGVAGLPSTSRRLPSFPWRPFDFCTMAVQRLSLFKPTQLQPPTHLQHTTPVIYTSTFSTLHFIFWTLPATPLYNTFCFSSTPWRCTIQTKQRCCLSLFKYTHGICISVAHIRLSVGDTGGLMEPLQTAWTFFFPWAPDVL
jgi:hypothetical protein